MPLITAHSGCDNTEDNSIEFLTYALNIEVDCVEIDVQKNDKGILVLSHDEADQNAPLLEEAFFMLREHPDKKMNCDLKQRNLEFEVYDLAKKIGVEKQLIYSGCVNLDLIGRGSSELSAVEIFLNIEILFPEVYELCRKQLSSIQGSMNNASPEEYKLFMNKEFYQRLCQKALKALNYGIRCINVEYHLCTEPFLAFLKENKILCSAWTVNNEAEIRNLLMKNIYNVTTRTAYAALRIRGESKR